MNKHNLLNLQECLDNIKFYKDYLSEIPKWRIFKRSLIKHLIYEYLEELSEYDYETLKKMFYRDFMNDWTTKIYTSPKFPVSRLNYETFRR